MKQIIWTNKATESFNDVINYLTKEFTEKEVDNFIIKTYNTIDCLTVFPEMFPKTKQLKGYHKAVVTPQSSMFYRITKENIVISRFWDNRRNPKTLHPKA